MDLIFGAAQLVVDKSAWLMHMSVACLKCNDPDLFLSMGLKLETVKPVGLSLETICLWLSSGKLGNLNHSASSYLKNPVGSRMCVWLTHEKPWDLSVSLAACLGLSP